MSGDVEQCHDGGADSGGHGVEGATPEYARDLAGHDVPDHSAPNGGEHTHEDRGYEGHVEDQGLHAAGDGPYTQDDGVTVHLKELPGVPLKMRDQGDGCPTAGQEQIGGVGDGSGGAFLHKHITQHAAAEGGE